MVSRLKKIVVSEHVSKEAAHWLAKRCQMIMCRFDEPGFAQEIADADALVVHTYTILDRARLDGALNLKVIGRAGTGLDNIDLEVCRERGIEVVYRPEANTQAVVEYVFCLLADALRPRQTMNCAVDHSTWNQLRADLVGKRQMNELTLGILGLGRIGKRVARVGVSFGMRVLYNDLLDIPEHDRFGAEAVSVETLFSSCDVVSLHVDGRESNRNFVRDGLLQRMKKDALLINTSRGFIVDNASLANVLKKNQEMLALIDVHESEPFPDDYPLLGLPNVRLYPHLASRSVFAIREMSWVVKDVMAVLEGRTPEYSVPQ